MDLEQVRRRSLQCCCGERGLKRRPLSPHPYPRSIGRDQPELLYARLNGLGGKVKIYCSSVHSTEASQLKLVENVVTVPIIVKVSV